MRAVLRAAGKFNLLSEERSGIFVDKLLARLEERKEGIGMLVAGGYHRAGIEKKLRERGVSYITLERFEIRHCGRR